MVISVIVPCYSEIEVLQPLFERLTTAAASWNRPYEVLVVDDGSREPTWKLLQSIHERDPRWRVVRFARNFGHQTAVSAGLFYARGDAVLILDADLGEYVGRIYDEVKRRPLWVVREMLDAESDTASLASEHRIGRNWKAE